MSYLWDKRHQDFAADPVRFIRTVSSGKPSGPCFREISAPVIVPTTLSVFMIGKSMLTDWPLSRSWACLRISRLSKHYLVNDPASFYNKFQLPDQLRDDKAFRIVQTLGFPMINCFTKLKFIDTTNHFVDGSES